MSDDERKAKLESRIEEVKAEFEKGNVIVKGLQDEIAERQRKIAAVRETQVRLQGANAELKRQLDELFETEAA